MRTMLVIFVISRWLARSSLRIGRNMPFAMEPANYKFTSKILKIRCDCRSHRVRFGLVSALLNNYYISNCVSGLANTWPNTD